MQQEVKEFFRHIEYIQKSKTWNNIDIFLRGDERFLKSPEFLFPHPSEQPERAPTTREKKAAEDNRRLREMRTEYKNYLKMIVNRYVSLIFKGGLEYEGLEEALGQMGKEIIADIDGLGNNVSMFGQQLLKDLLAYGYAYVMPDKVTSQSTTLAQQVENKERSYLRRLEPLSVADWQRDAQGRLQMFRYEYELLKPRTSLDQEPFLGRYCMVGAYDTATKTFTLALYVSSDDKKRAINYYPASKKVQPHKSWVIEGEEITITNLEEIPLSVCSTGDSWLEDLVPILRKIYNKESDLDNIIYNQGYDKVFLFADVEGAIDAEGKPLENGQAEATIGYSTVTVLPTGGNVIKLDPTMPQAIITGLLSDVADLFKVAFNLTRTTSTDSKTAESAETRKEAKEELLTRIENKRTELLALYSKALNKLVQHHSGSKAEVKLQFKSKVDAADMQELASFVKTILDRIVNYPLWLKAVDKKLAQSMGFADENEIIKEISDTVLKAPAKEQEDLRNKATNQLKAVINGRE